MRLFSVSIKAGFQLPAGYGSLVRTPVPARRLAAPGPIAKYWIIPGLLAFYAMCASAQECGPLFQSGRDVDGNNLLRAAGPFFERRTSADGRSFTAVRPFFSRTSDIGTARVLDDYLWPLGMIKAAGGQTYWRFLTGFGHDFDNQTDGDRFRFVVFPLFFTGISAEGTRYFGLFPLGGDVREFLGRDRIVFALFPLYLYSSINDVESRSVLWPIIGWTRGDGVRRFRVFPFYAVSEREGAFKSKALMWPFWTSSRFFREDGSEKGNAFVLFPFYGRINTGERQGWMLLPPFFKKVRSSAGLEVNCPWPFIQYAGGDVDKLYLWPLFGHKRSPKGTSGFFLWPLFMTSHSVTGKTSTDRFSFMPFVYSRKTTVSAASAEASGSEPAGPSGKTGTGNSDVVTARDFKLWPLLSYRREGSRARFRILDLWPLMHTAGVERNLAPLWTLYSRESSDAAVEHDFLWGLFKRRRESSGGGSVSLFPFFSSRSGPAAEEREWSILGGLVGSKTSGLHRSWKILYFIKAGDEKPAGDDQ